MKAVAFCLTVVTLLGLHTFPVDGINQNGIPMDQRIPAIFRSSRQTIGGTMNYDLSFEKMVNLMKGFMKPKAGQGGDGAAKQPASATEAPVRKETEKPAAKVTKESKEESSSGEDDAGKARAAKPAPEAEPSKGEAVASEAVESGSEEKRGNGLPPMNGGKSSEKDED